MDRTRAEAPGTDEWWTKRLMEKLARQGREAAELRQWYEGKPPLPYPDSQKPVYERLQSIARINLASLIVDARLFRLNLTGAKTSVDQSPKKYINDKKLERSCQMLLENRYTISEISLRLGYSSIHYFSKSFNMKYHMSPSEFVKQNCQSSV